MKRNIGKWLLRICLLPVLIIMFVIKLITAIVNHCTGWIFRVIGIVLLLVTACCFFMELETAAELRRMLVGSLIFFFLPQVAELMIVILEVLELLLRRVYEN